MREVPVVSGLSRNGLVSRKCCMLYFCLSARCSGRALSESCLEYLCIISGKCLNRVLLLSRKCLDDMVDQCL